MRLLLIIILVLTFDSPAAESIAFIGLSSGNAPSLEKGYEKLLREKLSTEPDLYTVDYLECGKYRRAIRFDDYPSVSRNHLDGLTKFSDDSALILWGTVKSLQLTNERKKVIFSAIRGELRIDLHIYSLQAKDFLFSGDVSAIVYKSKGIGIFKPEQPISAADRSELMGMLQTEAAGNSCRVIVEAVKAAKEGRKDEGFSGEIQTDSSSVSDRSSPAGSQPQAADPALAGPPLTEPVISKDTVP